MMSYCLLFYCLCTASGRTVGRCVLRRTRQPSLPPRTMETKGLVNAASQIKAITHTHTHRNGIKPRGCRVTQLCSAGKAAHRIREGQRARRTGHTQPELTANVPHCWLSLRFCALCHHGRSRLTSPSQRDPQLAAAFYNWKKDNSTLITLHRAEGPLHQTDTNPSTATQTHLAVLRCLAFSPLSSGSWNQRKS